MEPSEIAEIRKRLEKATPGPYDFFVDPDDATFRIVQVDGYGNTLRLIAKIPAEHNWANGEMNAVFFAAAPTDIRALLDEYGSLRSRVQELENERETDLIGRQARMNADLLESLAASQKEVERLKDENYTDLLDQMDEAWGKTPLYDVGRVEVNAFLESRIIHKPTASLRAQLANVRNEVVDEARTKIEDLSAEWERRGDYGINSGYVSQVRAVNAIITELESMKSKVETVADTEDEDQELVNENQTSQPRL